MLKTLKSKEFTYGGFIFRKTCAPRIILREVCELKVKFRNISIYPAPASKQLSCRYKKPTGKGAQELGGKPNQKCHFCHHNFPFPFVCPLPNWGNWTATVIYALIQHNERKAFPIHPPLLKDRLISSKPDKSCKYCEACNLYSNE
jgi:hypothetical protein